MGMDGVEIVMAVEDAFDIRIEDSEAEKITTPAHLIEIVQAKVTSAAAHRSQRTWRREQIADAVRKIVIDVLGCEKHYREDAQFIKDLGMD